MSMETGSVRSLNFLILVVHILLNCGLFLQEVQQSETWYTELGGCRSGNG